jgi:hypothetical protein
LAPAARSIAPPTAGAVSFSLVAQAVGGAQRDVLLAGIDQPRVDIGFGRRRTHAQDAVLGMEDHLALQRHVVGDHGGNADAQIDVPSLGDVAGNARRHLRAAERLEISQRGVGHRLSLLLVAPASGGGAGSGQNPLGSP